MARKTNRWRGRGDVIGNAVHVMRVATGEAVDADKDAAAVALGRKGGAARAASLSAAKRSAIARKAAESRWAKSK